MYHLAKSCPYASVMPAGKTKLKTPKLKDIQFVEKADKKPKTDKKRPAAPSWMNPTVGSVQLIASQTCVTRNSWMDPEPESFVPESCVEKTSKKPKTVSRRPSWMDPLA